MVFLFPIFAANYASGMISAIANKQAWDSLVAKQIENESHSRHYWDTERNR